MVELPIVIGTWPRADIPIDDDDDDDIIQNMGELMISDESDEDNWVHEQEELEFKRQSMVNEHKRSGSNGSMASMSSWSTLDRRISSSCNTPSTNSTLLTPGSNTETYYRNTLPPVAGHSTTTMTTTTTTTTTNGIYGYLNRSTSTPDLLANISPPIQQTRPRVIDPTFRTSFYEQLPSHPPSTHHRPTQSVHSIQSAYLPYHRRLGSDEIYTDVPSHTLTMISSTPTHPPLPVQKIQPISESSDDDDDDYFDEEDEDDLFAIIEKKKKQEKELRKRQRMSMYE